MSREPDSHRHALRQRVLSAPCLLFHPSREIGRPDEQRARISALRGRQSTLTYGAMVPEARFALACLAAAVSETAMYPFHHSGANWCGWSASLRHGLSATTSSTLRVY